MPVPVSAMVSMLESWAGSALQVFGSVLSPYLNLYLSSAAPFNVTTYNYSGLKRSASKMGPLSFDDLPSSRQEDA